MAPEPEHHEHHGLFHDDQMDAQHKRDMEQLAKFGYKQDLRRSLGFFSTFAIAFSFISATNGFYALFYYGLDIGGPAGLIWQWPIIVFGQFMVALVFAEAASHYPLAGGIYQWAKRFLGGDYGWWVAWVFATALVVTVAAVAFGMPMGPIALNDLVGLDTSLFAGHVVNKAYADRAKYLGDPDFVQAPVAGLTNKAYAAELRKGINLERATRSADVSAGKPPAAEGEQTTHFSIMDRDGNRAAVTITLNLWFGAGLMIPGTGILLNNQMDDFSIKPGTPNAYQLIGADANAIEKSSI